MTLSARSAFDPEAVTGVMGHMNGHHRDDCLLITRAFGDLDEVVDAVLTDLTPDGALFTAITPQGPVDVQVPWARPMVERADHRAEMARMYRDSCHALGLTPRSSAD
jgi:hypothetical protein